MGSHLALDPATSDNERTDYLRVIKRNGNHLLELIGNILEISKIEAGHIQLTQTNFDWKVIFLEVIELLMPSSLAKSLVLKYQIPDSLSPLMWSDAKMFRQIITNLIGNAIKFTNRGSIRIELGELLDAKTNKSNLQLSVKDTGVGISQDERKNLFSPFQQTDSGRNCKSKGTGLGLDLSRKLAVALGGNIELTESACQIGSTFLLTLPTDAVSLANSCQKTRVR